MLKIIDLKFNTNHLSMPISVLSTVKTPPR